MPFGSGQRICMGPRLGKLQVKIGLISMLQRYDFTLGAKYLENELEFCPKTFVTAPKFKLPLILKRRLLWNKSQKSLQMKQNQFNTMFHEINCNFWKIHIWKKKLLSMVILEETSSWRTIFIIIVLKIFPYAFHINYLIFCISVPSFITHQIHRWPQPRIRCRWREKHMTWSLINCWAASWTGSCVCVIIYLSSICSRSKENIL